MNKTTHEKYPPYLRTLPLACVAVAIAAVSAPAFAVSGYTEARNDAMGGTGVASSKYTAAPLANPALLSAYDDSDDFAVVLPAAGVQVSDQDRMTDGFDDISDEWDRLEHSRWNGNSAQSADKLLSLLDKYDGKSLRAEAGVSAVVAIPNGVLPAAVVINSHGQAKATARVTDADRGYLAQVAAGREVTQEDLDNLTSRAEGSGAVVTDVGISLAHPFTLADTSFSAGITPKFQRVDTWNYNVSIGHYDSGDFHSEASHGTKNGMNVDAGIAAYITPSWTVGLAGKNLVSRSVDTKEVNGVRDTYNIRPQITAGTAWSNGFVTLAADADLTPASGFASDEKAQYLGVGAEFNAGSWAQLRAGYRLDMRDSDNNVFTAGVGVSPFDVVHLDLTGLAGTERTYGAVLQLSVTF